MSRFLKVTPRLPVANLTRTIDFYCKVLGFQVGALWPEDQPNFVILERNEVMVQFYLAADAEEETTERAILSFDVTDARALHQSISGQLVVEWGPEVYWYGRREFAVRDPDGHLIIFSEDTADPPTCAEG